MAGARELSRASFIRAPIPFTRVLPVWSNHLPKGPPPGTISLGVIMSPCGCWGWGHKHSLCGRHMVQLSPTGFEEVFWGLLLTKHGSWKEASIFFSQMHCVHIEASPVTPSLCPREARLKGRPVNQGWQNAQLLSLGPWWNFWGSEQPCFLWNFFLMCSHTFPSLFRVFNIGYTVTCCQKQPNGYGLYSELGSLMGYIG